MPRCARIASSCHDVHGSNHKRMLTQKAPTLCYNCHLTGSGHFGSGDNYSTEKGVPVAPTGAPSGYPTANSRFVGRVLPELPHQHPRLQLALGRLLHEVTP